MTKPRLIANSANDNSIDGDRLADGTISSDKLASGALTSNIITYTSPIVGGQTRSVQSKLGDVVSVKDFGAAGDGSDDTAAIQNAVNSSKFVYFPPGTYGISDTITVPGGVSLAGPAAGSRVWPVRLRWTGNDLTKDVLKLVTTSPGGLSFDRRGIENLAIVPATSGNRARAAISVNGVMPYVRDCTIEGNNKSFLFGIEGRAFSFEFSGNYVAECGVGIWVDYPDITSSLISRNFVQNCVAAGLVLIGPTGVVVSANSFEGFLPYRIVAGNSSAFGANGLEICGNYMFGVGTVQGILCAKDVTPAITAMSALIDTHFGTSGLLLAEKPLFTPSTQSFKAIHIHSNSTVEGPVVLDGISAGDAFVHSNFLGSTSGLIGAAGVLQDVLANNVAGNVRGLVHQQRATIGPNTRNRPTRAAYFQTAQGSRVKLGTAKLLNFSNNVLVGRLTGAGGDHFSGGSGAALELAMTFKFYSFGSTAAVVTNGVNDGAFEVWNGDPFDPGSTLILNSPSSTSALLLVETEYQIWFNPGANNAFTGEVQVYSPTPSGVTFGLNSGN
jgi:hypothetical protein